MNKIKLLAITPLLIAMHGCSSNSDSIPAATSPATAPTAVSGLFLDAEVEGLSYTTTSGITGITDVNGTYNYLPGEDVSFAVGAVDIGTVTGAPVCTPFDFGAASINIARFIQSLDADGDPTNGIDIVAANTALANTSISSDAFIADDATFTANPDIAAALVTTGDTLIDATTATDNLNAGTDFTFDSAELENKLFVTINPTDNNIGIVSFDTAASADAFDVSVAETTQAGGDGLRLDTKWSIDSNGVLTFTDITGGAFTTVTRIGGSSRSISVTFSEDGGNNLPATWLIPQPVTVADLGGDGVTVTSKTYDSVDLDGSTFSVTFNSDSTLANGLGGTFAVDVEAPGVITENENEFPNETAFSIILNGNLNVVGETVDVLGIGTKLIGGTPADPVREYFVMGVGSLTLKSTNQVVNPALAFTEQELAGLEYYSVFLQDDVCPNPGAWILETISFDGAGNFTFTGCNGFREGVYSVLAGVIQIDYNGNTDFGRRTDFINAPDEWRECWDASVLATTQCTNDELSFAFRDLAAAQAFLNQQNNP